MATVRITTEATWSLQRHNDHYEYCTMETKLVLRPPVYIKNNLSKRIVFQMLASNYVIKEVFNDKLGKEKVYIWRYATTCVVLLYLMAYFFVFFFFLTLPFITIDFDVDTLSPHLLLVTSVSCFWRRERLLAVWQKLSCVVARFCEVAYRGGVWGVQNPPPPEIPKFWRSCILLQIERKMFSVPITTS